MGIDNCESSELDEMKAQVDALFEPFLTQGTMRFEDRDPKGRIANERLISDGLVNPLLQLLYDLDSSEEARDPDLEKDVMSYIVDSFMKKLDLRDVRFPHHSCRINLRAIRALLLFIVTEFRGRFSVSEALTGKIEQHAEGSPGYDNIALYLELDAFNFSFGSEERLEALALHLLSIRREDFVRSLTALDHLCRYIAEDEGTKAHKYLLLHVYLGAKGIDVFSDKDFEKPTGLMSMLGKM